MVKMSEINKLVLTVRWLEQDIDRIIRVGLISSRFKGGADKVVRFT